MSKRNHVPAPVQDVEQLAQAARLKRQLAAADELNAAINTISDKYNCNAVMCVAVNGGLQPLAEVFRLPVQVVFVARVPVQKQPI